LATKSFGIYRRFRTVYRRILSHCAVRVRIPCGAVKHHLTSVGVMIPIESALDSCGRDVCDTDIMRRLLEGAGVGIESRPRNCLGRRWRRSLRHWAKNHFPLQTFFLFCIVRGYRCGEVGTLQWSDLDAPEETAQSLMLPHMPRMVWRRLVQLSRHGERVFHPRREGGSFWSPQTAHLNWGRIRARAGLPGLELNAVRYTWSQWTARQDGQCRHSKP
jgi:hypothetical protein